MIRSEKENDKRINVAVKCGYNDLSEISGSERPKIGHHVEMVKVVDDSAKGNIVDNKEMVKIVGPPKDISKYKFKENDIMPANSCVSESIQQPVQEQKAESTTANTSVAANNGGIIPANIRNNTTTSNQKGLYGYSIPTSIINAKENSLLPYNLNIQDDSKISAEYGLPLGHYHYKDRFLYHNNIPVGNFMVRFDSVKQCEENAKYEVTIYVYGEEYTTEFNVQNLKNLRWLSCIPRIIIRKDDLVIDYLHTLIMNRVIPKQIVLSAPGWNKINGIYYYVTPDGVIGHQELPIRSSVGPHFAGIWSNEAVDINFLEMVVAVTKQNPAAQILLLYDSLSLSYTIYKDAGCVLKFLIFILGERGAKKTSMALAVTQPELKAAAEFTMKSTAAGLESGFREHSDSVMIIDDLHPAVSAAESRRLSENLDTITRVFGDANGKRRDLSFSEGNHNQYTTAGGCCVTGEFVSGMESSLARTIFLKLGRNDVDTDILTRIQNNHIKLSLFFVKYIQYLSQNTGRIMNIIRERVGFYRASKVGVYSNDRYAEYWAQLMVSAELVYGNFCVETGILTQDAAQQIIQRCVVAIDTVIYENNRDLQEHNPATILCKAILSAMDNGVVKVLQLGEPFVGENTVIKHNGAIYTTKETILWMYENYMKSNGIIHERQSTKRLLDVLVGIKGISVTHEGSEVRRTCKLEKYGNKRFVCLHEAVLRQQINQ